MPSQPNWSVEEWVLLLDLYAEYGAHPPAEAIGSLRAEMRSLALSHGSPSRRRHATDPGFRTRASIARQLSDVNALHEGRVIGRRPRNLSTAWNLYLADPELLRNEARQVRREIPSVDVADETPPSQSYPTDDARQLAGFVHELVELLDDVRKTIQQLPVRLLDEEVLEQHQAAWDDLKEVEPAETIAAELRSDEVAERLSDAGLTGAHLRMKLSGFGRSLVEWFQAHTVRAAKGALSWANLILASMQSAVLAPVVELLKEFKDASEKLMDEATVEGAYLPAPGPRPAFA